MVSTDYYQEENENLFVVCCYVKRETGVKILVCTTCVYDTTSFECHNAKKIRCRCPGYWMHENLKRRFTLFLASIHVKTQRESANHKLNTLSILNAMSSSEIRCGCKSPVSKNGVCPSCFPFVAPAVGIPTVVGQQRLVGTPGLPSALSSYIPTAQHHFPTNAAQMNPYRITEEEDSHETKPCRHGLCCKRADCYFEHPSDWNPWVAMKGIDAENASHQLEDLHKICWSHFWKCVKDHMEQTLHVISQICVGKICKQNPRCSPQYVYQWAVQNESFRTTVQKIYRKLFAKEVPFKVWKISDNGEIRAEGEIRSYDSSVRLFLVAWKTSKGADHSWVPSHRLVAPHHIQQIRHVRDDPWYSCRGISFCEDVSLNVTIYRSDVEPFLRQCDFWNHATIFRKNWSQVEERKEQDRRRISSVEPNNTTEKRSPCPAKSLLSTPGEGNTSLCNDSPQKSSEAMTNLLVGSICVSGCPTKTPSQPSTHNMKVSDKNLKKTVEYEADVPNNRRSRKDEGPDNNKRVPDTNHSIQKERRSGTKKVNNEKTSNESVSKPNETPFYHEGLMDHFEAPNSPKAATKSSFVDDYRTKLDSQHKVHAQKEGPESVHTAKNGKGKPNTDLMGDMKDQATPIDPHCFGSRVIKSEESKRVTTQPNHAKISRLVADQTYISDRKQAQNGPKEGERIVETVHTLPSQDASPRSTNQSKELCSASMLHDKRKRHNFKTNQSLDNTTEYPLAKVEERASSSDKNSVEPFSDLNANDPRPLEHRDDEAAIPVCPGSATSPMADGFVFVDEQQLYHGNIPDTLSGNRCTEETGKEAKSCGIASRRQCVNEILADTDWNKLAAENSTEYTATAEGIEDVDPKTKGKKKRSAVLHGDGASLGNNPNRTWNKRNEKSRRGKTRCVPRHSENKKSWRHAKSHQHTSSSSQHPEGCKCPTCQVEQTNLAQEQALAERHAEYRARLDVTETATAAEIRKAYRRLVVRVHPDKLQFQNEIEAKQAEDEFHKLHEAYKNLMGDDDASKG